MGTLIIGGEQTALPFAEMGAVLQRRKQWSGEWEIDIDLEPDRLDLHTGSQGTSKLTFLRRYGQVKPEYEAAQFSERKPLDIGWHWVRLVLLGEEGEFPVWVGRVENDDRDLKGASLVRTGDQLWNAYGPDSLLRKTEVYQSYWNRSGTRIEVDWHPAFNLRDESEYLTGNRSNSKVDGSYLFGGTDTWSNFDALEYLIARHLTVSGQPVWTLGGQVDILKNLQLRIPLSVGFNLEQAIGALIDPKYGVDWKIVLTAQGFEISVFALTNVTQSFGVYSLPKNPNEVRIRASDSVDLRCQVEISRANLYDRLRVVGARIKSTCSFALHGSDFRSLWTSALETQYKAGAGGSAQENDGYRADDRFRDVYQAFAATAAWDWQGGEANPRMLLDGSIDISTPASYQTAVRRTLRQLCLREGFNYTQNPPVNNNVSGVEADFLPPLAIVYDADKDRYCPVDKLSALDPTYPGVAVGILENDWGIRLRSPHNHMFARNHWSGAAASQIDPSIGGFDYESLKFTITIETDHRIALGLDLPEALRSGSGLTKVIEVPGAEYWWLAPYAILGVASDGLPEFAPASGMVLRDDTHVLAAIMAGAVARYLDERARASIDVMQLGPWHDLLGQILTTVEDQGDIQHIGAPITSLSMHFRGKRRMTIQTGHATR